MATSGREFGLPPSPINYSDTGGSSIPCAPLPAFATLLLSLASAPAAAAPRPQPIKIAGLVELSGPGATSGTNFNDGVKLAVEGDQRRGRHPGPTRRVHRRRTRSRSRRWRRRWRSKAHRRRRVRGDGTGVLRLDPGQHGGDASGRRSRTSPAAKPTADHAAGQSVHLPHVRSRRPARCPRWRAISRTP